MSELKEKYIQLCCDFYNEHANEDKIWFGRMFDDCHQEHNKRNSSMYRWQFPLMILKSQQAEINQHQLEIHALGEANLNQAMMLAKKQEEIDSLKAQLNNMEACYIEKKKECEDQHKKVDEVLEYLDGESANRWGLWKEKADMLDQGASNAFEEAYWMVKKALRGEHD